MFFLLLPLPPLPFLKTFLIPPLAPNIFESNTFSSILIGLFGLLHISLNFLSWKFNWSTIYFFVGFFSFAIFCLNFYTLFVFYSEDDTIFILAAFFSVCFLVCQIFYITFSLSRIPQPRFNSWTHTFLALSLSLLGIFDLRFLRVAFRHFVIPVSTSQARQFYDLVDAFELGALFFRDLPFIGLISYCLISYDLDELTLLHSALWLGTTSFLYKAFKEVYNWKKLEPPQRYSSRDPHFSPSNLNERLLSESKESHEDPGQENTEESDLGEVEGGPHLDSFSIMKNLDTAACCNWSTSPCVHDLRASFCYPLLSPRLQLRVHF